MTTLVYLRPKADTDTETDWADPWRAVRDVLPTMFDQVTAARITESISTDPTETARLRKARQDVREGKRSPRPRDASPP